MTTATQNSIHEFEKAGLGKAPFRIIGVGDKVGPILLSSKDGVQTWCGAPGQPMGVCKFCGQGIMECWSIRSADGNVFDVGCDCVRKTGDAGMKKVIDAHKSKIRREKAHAKAKEAREFIDSVLNDPNLMHKLYNTLDPHPKFATRTRGDSLVWLRRNCGDSGMVRTAKTLRGWLS